MLARKLQYLRNVVMLLFSLFLTGAGYMNISTEPVFVLILAIGFVLLLLTVLELIFLIRKKKHKSFFYANCVLQLMPLFVMAGLGGLSPLGFAAIGGLLLNLAIIVSLKKEK